jgi:hypothetical protein
LVNSPETVGGFLSWVISLTDGVLVMPPNVLLVSGYWFFVAMGVWGIASGVLRYYLWVYPMKSVQEVFNGLFSLVWAGFIRFYLMNVFNLTFFAASIVMFFVAQIIFAVYYSRYSD